MEEYKRDSNIIETETTRYYSMDLQKVILSSNMPHIKFSYFVSRLVVFNETFATISKSSSYNSHCVLWHEAINGRKAENLTDAIVRIIDIERDVTKIVFWSDNCCAQNKNRILFSALVNIVNLENGPDEVIIKYLTKGHTHMSADGIHGNIEAKIRRKGKVFDFQDLISTIEGSRNKLTVLPLKNFVTGKIKRGQQKTKMTLLLISN